MGGGGEGANPNFPRAPLVLLELTPSGFSVLRVGQSRPHGLFLSVSKEGSFSSLGWIEPPGKSHAVVLEPWLEAPRYSQFSYLYV